MESGFDSKKMTKIVKDLSTIPRLVGSEGETKGINYCKKTFKEIGIDFKEEFFECTRGWVGWIQQSIFLIASILIVIMNIFLFQIPWLNLLVIAIILIVAKIVFPGIDGTTDFKIIGKSIQSKNLFASIPPKDGKVPDQFVILSAHHDTKSQLLSTIQRSVAYFLTGLGLIIFLIIAFIGIIIDFIPEMNVSLEIKYIGLSFGIVALLGTISLSLNFLSNNSPGAIDNASGIAVVHQVAKRIKDQGGLENTEFIIAIFGAEELGTWGARAFGKKHLNEYPIDSTVSINLDMVGFKDSTVEILETYGIPIRKKVSPFMNNLAYKAAKEHGISIRGVWMPIGASTDGFALRDYGYDGCDFITIKATTIAHRKKDTIDYWDEKIALQNCKIIYSMIDKIDIHKITNMEN